MFKITTDNEAEIIREKKYLYSRVSRIKFVTRNMKCLFKAEYFATKELLFLLEISCYAGYRDNLIFINKFIQTRRYELMELIPLLNSLVHKGAILVDIRDENALFQPLIQDGALTPGISLILNPEIAYNGPFFKMPVNLVNLCRLTDIIEKSGIELPWKIRVNRKRQVAYLCNRYGYLKDSPNSKKIEDPQME